MKETLKIILAVATTALVCGLGFYLNAAAFNGPTHNPPTGSGQLAVGVGGNISIGTSTPATNAELLIVGSTTADSGNYSLEVFDSSHNPLLSVRNDGVVTFSTSTVISGGAFAGTVSAGNISAGQFGSNTGGGNYIFPAGVTATSGMIALASTTITGNTTTTSFTVTGVTNALHLAGAGGAVSGYGGSSCSAGNAVTAISATGTATCGTFGSSSANGTVTTSSAITTNNFPFWGTTAGALSGTSTLTISGTTVTQTGGFTQTGGSVSLATTTVSNLIDTGTDATTTASFGAVALKQGTCTSSTVSVPGVSTSAVVIVTPQAFPGTGVWWEGYISTTGTAVVEICAATTTTPTARQYNVRIIR